MSKHRAVFLLFIAVALSACGGSEPAVETTQAEDEIPEVATDPTVRVVDDVFEPAELVVASGTEVTWVWEGDNEHDVVSAFFDSGDPQTSGNFSHTFEEPRLYAYRCTLHTNMVGTVLVVP